MEAPPQYIFVENVKGFEDSDSRDLLVDMLKESNYLVKEYLVTPTQIGIPNQVSYSSSDYQHYHSDCGTSAS